MWRNMRTGLLVAATVVLVYASFPVRGEDSTAMSDKVEVPSFQVEVMVSPAMGLMKIPPANPPSWPFTALVRIRDSEVGRLWSMRLNTVYAGDQVEEEGTYGPYRITCTMKIDERGEAAGVDIRVVRMDGSEPVHITHQKFLAHLPRSQKLPG